MTAYTDNVQYLLKLKAYRYFTSMGSGTSDARRTFFSSSVSINTRPPHPSDVDEGQCTDVDHLRQWSRARCAGQCVAWHVTQDDLMIFAFDSRQRSPSRSASVLRPSDVEFPPGHESRTPKTSRRYWSRQLLLAGVFTSRPHRRPGAVSRLSPAPSPL